MKQGKPEEVTSPKEKLHKVKAFSNELPPGTEPIALPPQMPTKEAEGEKQNVYE
jgi:hypothetical protein